MLSETTGVVKTRLMCHNHRKPATVMRCKDSVIIVIKKSNKKFLCKITHSLHKNLNLDDFI